MQYEEALKRWGLKKLNTTQRYVLKERGHGGYEQVNLIAGEWPNVTVEMNFNEGYACCGGNDPDCYCSFAESPSAEVQITHPSGARYYIDLDSFDFAKVLGEIVAAANGTITNE